MKREIHERKLINIKRKINQNHLIIIKGDKGNTLVIIHENEYIKSVSTQTQKLLKSTQHNYPLTPLNKTAQDH
jgi:hypothetical protein